MVEPNQPRPQRPGVAPADEPIANPRADEIETTRAEQPRAQTEERSALMGETAAASDPDTGAAGTTNPRTAVPSGSTSPTGVAPPRPNQTRWLVIAAAGVIGVILILLLLT